LFEITGNLQLNFTSFHVTSAKSIKQEAQNGDMTNVIILEYLITHTTDQLIEMLEMSNNFPVLIPYIQKIKDNRNWVNAVLENLKQ
jgi:hypothetical protein